MERLYGTEAGEDNEVNNSIYNYSFWPLMQLLQKDITKEITNNLCPLGRALSTGMTTSNYIIEIWWVE